MHAYAFSGNNFEMSRHAIGSLIAEKLWRYIAQMDFMLEPAMF
jgi:hypothetical protein